MLQPEASPSSHSASLELDSPSSVAAHTRLLRLLESVGVAPSSHSGSEPSSHAKDPFLARTGVLPSSQEAGDVGACLGAFRA